MAELVVETARGAIGLEPVRFGREGALFEVAEVLDRWPGDDHAYFRVRTPDGAVYLLRHDLPSARWAIAFFEHEVPAGVPDPEALDGSGRPRARR